MKKKILLLFLLSPSLFSFEEEGIASWYGGQFHGRLTANGEQFDTYQLTAAHKELPFGSIVTVTNLDNGSCVVVRINDRGPFVGDRVIDLSFAAAQQLNMIKSGTAKVRLEAQIPDPDNQFFTFQLAAYRDIDNARKQKVKLFQNGHSATLDIGEDKIIRLFLKNIPFSKVESVKEELHQQGFYSPVVIKQN